MNKKILFIIILVLYNIVAFAFKPNNATNSTQYIQIQTNKVFSKTDFQTLSMLKFTNLEYIENNIYFAQYHGNNLSDDKQKLNAIISIDSQNIVYKCPQSLLQHQIPNWASKNNNKLQVTIRWQKNIDINVVKDFLKQNFSIEFLNNKKEFAQRSLAWININDIEKIAQQNFVRYISTTLPNDVTLNNVSEAMLSDGYAYFSIANNGRNLKGDKLVVGVGDNTDPQMHIDIFDRLINFNGLPQNNHGYHTVGTVGGAGNIQPRYHGLLPKATIIAAEYSNILANTALYKSAYNMVLTNNSYGAVVQDCNYEGIYDDVSVATDELVLQFPDVNHIFAAGNDGGLSCANSAAGYNTILSSYQTAKNIITCANIDFNDSKNPGSSQGPIKCDNRLKPDVSALGTSVSSCYPNNTYGQGWGTSMASPAVTGITGQVIERYKQLHANNLPSSDLIKALILNGAYDLGLKGPDCSFGYGRVSADRSLTMLEKNNFFIDSIANGDSIVYHLQINTPNTMAKYLMYYHDVPSNAFCSNCLINNLDFYIKDPIGNIVLPYVINTSDTNSIKLPATHGLDSINNTEQVEINYGIAGIYTLVVKGTKVVNGLQRFVLVWDTLQPKLFLRSPIGSETFISGKNEIIFWDKYDTSIVNYSVLYTADNGINWITLAQNIPDSIHYFVWQPPASTSIGFKVKVIANNGLSATSNTFSAMPLAVLNIAPNTNQCPTYCNTNWSAIPGATDYLLLQKIGAYMQVVDSTTSTNYTFKNLNANTIYYFAVTPRKNGLLGQQSNAVSYTPNIGNCSLALYNNDLKIDSILLPIVGRQFTKTAFTNNENIKIVYSNQGNNNCSNYSLQYKIASNPIVTNNITIPLLAHSKDTLVIPFDLSTAQNYPVTISISNLSNTDANKNNDTLKTIIRQVPNNALNLTTPFVESFETAIDTSIFNKNGNAILGIERWDFTSDSTQGRLRTKVIDSFAHNGNFNATLDVNIFNNTLKTDSLIGTFNLSNYNVNSTDVRFDFFYKHHNLQDFNSDNAVYLRGSDTSNWIKIFDLLQNQNQDIGIYQLVKSLQLSKLLKLNNQNFSSSTQLKFTQSGMYKCIGNEGDNGYTFDDLKFYTVQNDIALVDLEPLSTTYCGLKNQTPITIKVENSSHQTINNIEAGYSVDGANYVSENITTIPADSTILFTFSASADLSNLGYHKLNIYIHSSTDSYLSNDSLINITIYNSPLINNFPYLQNFEINNGNYYTTGIHSSWQYGTPNTSLKINRAASGTKVWKTNLNGTYNTNENSYLFTPCFDISNLTHPMLSFSMAFQIENCGNTFCDGAFIEYTYDGRIWKRLDYDTSATIKSWYSDSIFAVWNGDKTYWKSYSFSLPKDAFGNAIQLRFVMHSDGGLDKEGIAIDDIHVYDFTNKIYADTNNSSVIIKTISSNSIQKFIDKNEIFASLTTTSNDVLDNCKVQLFTHNDSIIHPNNSYFIGRNITIKPENKISNDSILVRIYFLDSEVENILNDTLCIVCPKPRDAYDFGITKFSSIVDSIENGNLNDNTPGILLHQNNINIVPYVDGYYAEIKVKNFSEFWLNYAADTTLTLLLKWINFTAKNINNNNSLLNWSVENESANHHFEIERATGNTNYQNNNFITLDTIISIGGNDINNYSFSDNNIPNFNEVYYYRIKWVNNGGEYGYTKTIPVIFGNNLPWLLFPNPSNQPFIQFQIESGKTIGVYIYDFSGKIIQQINFIGDGFINKIPLNVSALSTGMYFIKLESKGRIEQFKWLKK